MDGLKLEKWRNSFEEQAKDLKLQYDTFLFPKKLEETYKLKIDETSQTLFLRINEENLPKEIADRLNNLLLKTTPEDSI